MRRFVFVGFLTIATVMGSMAVVLAQVPPLDEVTDPIEDTVNQVVDPVQDAVDQVDETVDQVVDTVEQTGSGVGGAVEDTVQGAGQAAGGGSSTTGAGTGATGAAGQVLGGSGQSNGTTGSSAGGAGGGSQQGQRGKGKTRGTRGPDRSTGDGADATQMARLDSQPLSQGLAPVAHIPLAVQLTNDADGDGTYRETETAPRPGAEVSFQLRLENAGPHELTILGIRNATPGPLASESEAVCGGKAGTRLSPGQSTVCRFTLPRVAAPPSERVVAVTEVDVAETADPTATGTITDTSVVRTSGVGVLGAVARRILGSLASTGAGIALLAAVAAGLAVVGGWMLRFGSRRPQPTRAKRAQLLPARPASRGVRRPSVTRGEHPGTRRDDTRVGATEGRD